MISSYQQRYKTRLSVLICFIQHCTKISSQEKEVSYLIGEKETKLSPFAYQINLHIHHPKEFTLQKTISTNK